MLGVQILLISVMASLVGLEASAPGCVRSVIVAAAEVTTAVNGGLHHKLQTKVDALKAAAL